MNTSSPGRPPSTSDIDPSLDGISGWLVLPAIGLILGLLTGYAALAATLGIADEISGSWLAFALLVDGGVFLLTLVTAAEFFVKRAHAPRLYIVLLWTNVAANGLVVMVLSSTAQDVGQVVGSVVAAVIWTLYFHRSKRVKATFRH